MQTGMMGAMKKFFVAIGLSCIAWTSCALAAPAASDKAPEANSKAATAAVDAKAPAAPAVADAKQMPKSQAQQALIEWKEFHSVAGKCRVSFPSNPEHVSQKLTTPEIGYDLRYDAYISSLDKQTVFMLLVAQYPDYVDQTYAQMSLEAFLNGILTYNPENQLIFADLLLVNGHEALDFFIRAGGVYFKGRALMVKNSLYLIAMECDVQIYDETNYNKFVDSFKLVVPDTKAASETKAPAAK